MRLPLKEFRGILATYLIPQLGSVLLLAILLLVSIALQLANPQILRIFIDTITAPGAHPYLTGIALLFIAGALAQQGVMIAATYVSERLGWLVTNALRADLALHLVRMDMSFHKTYTPGALIERVDGDVTALANLFSQFVIQVLGNVLLLLGILVVLWTINWQIGLALTLLVLVVLVVMIYVRSIAVPHWTAFRQVSADLFGFLEERFTGTEDIRSSGAQAYVLRRLYTYTRTRLQAARKARLISSIPWSIPLVAATLGNIIAFILAASLYRAGAMTLGTAFLIYYYIQLMLQPLNLITNQLDDFQKASAGLVRIREMLAIRSTLKDGPGVLFPAGGLSIEFDNVAFGYGDEEMVVQDLSFRVEAGSVLGLLGRTGSGKTTITRLLFRLYDPAAGSIRLHGSNLREARRSDLRRHIGIVTQDVQLFHATVRDNLTFFDSSIEDTRILQALSDLGLLPWYNRLADGLDTLLAAGGGGLSAGEAQLLAFARVFLRDPGVVILDEASSRLDPVTEHMIEHAIDKLLKGRTSIIIAHRLGTIQRADNILILENGRISEKGSRVELAADPESHFSHLLRTGYERVEA